ncbi:hypothetical protein MNBD_GAMMA10-1070, partial [hydrothermal vent metagenome]
FSQADHKPLSLGKIEMDVHQAERQQSGFHAVYDCTDRQLHLAANYKLGVLVIETFTSFKIERDRHGYIERDFFRPQPAKKTLSLTESALQKNFLVDLTPYAGIWVNSNKNEQSLLGFELTANGKNWQLQPSMVEREYAPVSVTAYLDNMGYLAFKACVELTHRQLTFAANTQKALVVMTTFIRFLPGSVHGPDKNQVYREIFLRDSKCNMNFN